MRTATLQNATIDNQTPPFERSDIRRYTGYAAAMRKPAVKNVAYLRGTQRTDRSYLPLAPEDLY
jgi:hypothetical protein